MRGSVGCERDEGRGYGGRLEGGRGNGVIICYLNTFSKKGHILLHSIMK